jgi:hypothetical protein
MHLAAETPLGADDPEPTTYAALGLGTVLEVDTTNFYDDSYVSLRDKVRQAIKEGIDE